MCEEFVKREDIKRKNVKYTIIEYPLKNFYFIHVHKESFFKSKENRSNIYNNLKDSHLKSQLTLSIITQNLRRLIRKEK